ncbi:MAG: tRNA lysidine(34) synthetase TilS [Sulfurospirillum sp.]
MQQSPQLHKTTIEFLKKGKNLLAFSAGVDSSALFFILEENKIDFDMAIVDYNAREQSKKEVKYAEELAKKYKKRLFTHSCKLEESNFEHNARVERYNFFEEIIKQYGFNNLITAHQLNDKMEWFLMQLGRGSGLVELLGMQEIEQNANYNKIKPLLQISKQELKEYLSKNDILHFIDESNSLDKYFRNRIRNKYSDSFIDEYAQGIKNSFKFLQKDKELLLPKNEKSIENLFILQREAEDLKNIRQIDKVIKKLGVLMSASQREEILRTKDCVISNKIVVVFSKNLIFISPYSKINMSKKFKESCRLAKIPLKIRPYIYEKSISVSELVHIL